MASNPDEEPDFYSMPALEAASATTTTNYNYPYSTIPKQEEDEYKDEDCPLDQDTYHNSSSTASLSRETSSIDDDDHEYVFNNMPFHIIEGYRRNSLFRRNSLLTSVTSSSVDLYHDGCMEQEEEPAVTSNDKEMMTQDMIKEEEEEEESDAAFFQDMEHLQCLVGAGPLYDDDELGQLLEQMVQKE
jgi:hypothetical protein